MWAMQYLEGEPKEAWYTRWERMLVAQEPLTWLAFTEFLLDQVDDPVNRRIDAAEKYNTANQKRDQTVRAFATYLDALESQMPQYNEAQLVMHLFAKLRPELRRALTNYHQIPTTREALISLASTLERNVNKSNAINSTQQRPATVTHTTSSKTVTGHTTPASSSNTHAEPQRTFVPKCYSCGQMGHKANDPVCKNHTSSANKTPVGIGRVSGKD